MNTTYTIIYTDKNDNDERYEKTVYAEDEEKALKNFFLVSYGWEKVVKVKKDK